MAKHIKEYMTKAIDKVLIRLSEEYNSPSFFSTDPVIFPKYFFGQYLKGEATLQDIEIAGILAAHLAWGRREMIVRDCRRMFDEMNWQPFSYISGGMYKNDPVSLHRTIKWSEFAMICNNLRTFYSSHDTLEGSDTEYIRTAIFGRKPDQNAANKKIHMFFRWMVRDDGIVDLGVWKNTSPSSLIIPLDVHVHRSALELGITQRKSADITTAIEITDYLKTLFPNDPCLGDFALFAFAASKNGIITKFDTENG
jgi:hypothetical protein